MYLLSPKSKARSVGFSTRWGWHSTPKAERSTSPIVFETAFSVSCCRNFFERADSLQIGYQNKSQYIFEPERQSHDFSKMDRWHECRLSMFEPRLRPGSLLVAALDERIARVCTAGFVQESTLRS